MYYVLVDNNVNGVENMGKWETNENMKKAYQNRISKCVLWTSTALNSRINMQQILFFLRNFSHLHALLEPPCLLIFVENSHLHDYKNLHVYSFFEKKSWQHRYFYRFISNFLF